MSVDTQTSFLVLIVTLLYVVLTTWLHLHPVTVRPPLQVVTLPNQGSPQVKSQPPPFRDLHWISSRQHLARGLNNTPTSSNGNLFSFIVTILCKVSPQYFLKVQEFVIIDTEFDKDIFYFFMKVLTKIYFFP